jgi:hypothetical protein
VLYHGHWYMTLSALSRIDTRQSHPNEITTTRHCVARSLVIFDSRSHSLALALALAPFSRTYPMSTEYYDESEKGMVTVAPSIASHPNCQAAAPVLRLCSRSLESAAEFRFGSIESLSATA